VADWQHSEQYTVVERLWASVDRVPDRTYLHFPDSTHTYAESYQEIMRIARGLREMGVQPGDTVTMMLDNSADAVFMWHAIIQIGAISVAINTALKGDFLVNVVADAASSVFIGEAEYIERLTKVAENVPNIDRVVYRGGAEIDGGCFSAKPFDEIRLDGDEIERVNAKPGDVCSLVYTGGTTGPSKGCMMSQNYLIQNAIQNNLLVARREGETSWNCLPIYHANLVETGILGPMVQGATSSIGTKFSLSGFWPAIKESGAQVAFLTGTMPGMIARMPDTEEMLECRGQLRALHAMPVPPDVERIWLERFGLEAAGAKGYGLTECHLVVDFPGGTQAGAKPGSAGKRNDDFDCRIFDDEDRELGPGEVGEVVVRPLKPHRMFEGYWNRPAETLRVSNNLWFHTGDLGMFDEDGFFFFLDRKKDYLRRRGENISSMEVEGVFLKHPDIAEVAVHAVYSEFTEDDLKVTAVLTEGASLSARELFEWSIERVPYFALPRYIEFRDELPKSPLGRIHKYLLREQDCTPTTWDREKEDVSFARR
jgi:crotonobetaine/carnitine-CoA ligase